VPPPATENQRLFTVRTLTGAPLTCGKRNHPERLLGAVHRAYFPLEHCTTFHRYLRLEAFKVTED
jgi:hypothetical protein